MTETKPMTLEITQRVIDALQVVIPIRGDTPHPYIRIEAGEGGGIVSATDGALAVEIAVQEREPGDRWEAVISSSALRCLYGWVSLKPDPIPGRRPDLVVNHPGHDVEVALADDNSLPNVRGVIAEASEGGNRSVFICYTFSRLVKVAEALGALYLDWKMDRRKRKPAICTMRRDYDGRIVGVVAIAQGFMD